MQQRSKKKRPVKSRKHIIIDAGHGGKDCGACAFGLHEKAMTLDIARRVCAMLRREGFRVSLTRNDDTYLSIEQRVLLAQQLKANLFISIHVNACPWVKKASGVETHFLNTEPFFGRNKNSSFLFVKNRRDRSLIPVANRMLYEKANRSKKLSSAIQNGVLQNLQRRNVSVVNRGVKSTTYRLLLHNKVPASIVEVGFITNPQEAKRLATCSHRQFLAEGVRDGVKRFLQSEN
jgi:N-acetylmuramoyl-L-alanine amidase